MSDFSPMGLDLFGEPVGQPGRGVLADEFGVPPFSVLSARDGAWQERKRAWIAMGLESEVGRPEITHKSPTARLVSTGHKGGVSVFDPVLAELHYRWLCPAGGQVLDPFAGGSVRGIVAGCMGFDYFGAELRTEQVEANRVQVEAIDPAVTPSWVVGDALDVVPTSPLSDYVFSCPPYGDLEVYSDDPKDLSTMDYHAFIAAMRRIILRCHAQLKQDRFATFVVGEYRGKGGAYVGFVPDVIRSFQMCGFEYYNEAILMTPCGSLPIRTRQQFNRNRMIGKTHQNILTFVKGCPRRATEAIKASQ